MLASGPLYHRISPMSFDLHHTQKVGSFSVLPADLELKNYAENILSISHRSRFSELVVLYLCEKCTSFLPVGPRLGWSGQFCVTDVPASVSSQHNKPSHIRPQNVPQERKKGKRCNDYTHFLCLLLYTVSVHQSNIISLQPWKRL